MQGLCWDLVIFWSWSWFLMGLKEGHRPWSVQFGEPLELFDPPLLNCRWRDSGPESWGQGLWQPSLCGVRMQAGWWTAHRTQCTPALTVPSSFLRAPSPGHVRKDYGRSHPPEAPCPAQVCTSAPLAGRHAPPPQPPEAFPGDPGTQRTLLDAPLAGAPTPSTSLP